jgi:hypothetical protein
MNTHITFMKQRSDVPKIEEKKEYMELNFGEYIQL